VRLSFNRTGCYKRNFHTFLNYCAENNLTMIEDVKYPDILKFIRKPGSQKHNDTYKLISSLRGYFKYLYEQNNLSIDYSIKIPKFKRVSQEKIPSTYSIDEIEKLLSSINRSSKPGKRDYAIL
jgi:site-specific recombinase XerD